MGIDSLHAEHLPNQMSCNKPFLLFFFFAFLNAALSNYGDFIFDTKVREALGPDAILIDNGFYQTKSDGHLAGEDAWVHTGMSYTESMASVGGAGDTASVHLQLHQPQHTRTLIMHFYFYFNSIFKNKTRSSSFVRLYLRPPPAFPPHAVYNMVYVFNILRWCVQWCADVYVPFAGELWDGAAVVGCLGSIAT